MEILFAVLLLVMFWLLLIRPAQRRQKAQTELQNSLEVGSRVMLTSGIFGVLTDVSEADRVRVQLAPGVEIEAVRAAIGAVVPEELDEPVVGEAAELPAEPDGPVDLDKRD